MSWICTSPMMPSPVSLLGGRGHPWSATDSESASASLMNPGWLAWQSPALWLVRWSVRALPPATPTRPPARLPACPPSYPASPPFLLSTGLSVLLSHHHARNELGLGRQDRPGPGDCLHRQPGGGSAGRAGAATPSHPASARDTEGGRGVGLCVWAGGPGSAHPKRTRIVWTPPSPSCSSSVGGWPGGGVGCSPEGQAELQVTVPAADLLLQRARARVGSRARAAIGAERERKRQHSRASADGTRLRPVQAPEFVCLRQGEGGRG